MPLHSNSSLKPGSTIGIIGGGQLGRMLAMAAARLGFKTITLDPGKDCPAAQVANTHIQANFDDQAALAKLAKSSDLITYEFENIPADALSFLEKNTILRPNRTALEKSQDRLVEKTFLNEIGIRTSPFFNVATVEQLYQAAGKVDTPSILKTRRFGYDGKGQVRLDAKPSKGDLDAAWKEIGESSSVLEGFVTFQCEISVIIARSVSGQTASYDPAQNMHRDGILRTSTLPAQVTADIRGQAREIAFKIVEALAYVGVMGVEFFVEPDGQLVVNEIAPRVHNSGHWTEAACAVSQFEQHIRAITGLPLGDPARYSDCIMENLIGNDMDRLPELLKESSLKIHLYGKAETRPGRKMGHITRLLPDRS